jgi:IPT/TIG domain
MNKRVFRPVSLLTVFSVLWLTGCALFNVTSPGANSTVGSPITVNISWGESLQSNTFTVVLYTSGSSSNVTSQFTIAPASGGGGTAAANLAVSPGSHSITVSGNLWTWYAQAYEFTSTTQSFTVAAPTLSLTASPNPLNLSVSGHATLTVATNGSGVTGPVSVTVGSLPSQVSATPRTFTIALSNSRSTTITAGSTASPGHPTVTVSGAAASGQLANTTVTLNVGSAPTISSVSPTTQTRRGPVTISGANFDTNCANDKVTIGGVATTPGPPCTAASLKVQVPAQASFEPNPGELTVTTGAGTSNAVSFVVARQTGAFIEITSNIEGQISNQTCSTEAVTLAVCSSNCGSNFPFVATYKKAAGGQIGQAIPFHRDNSRVSGLGGAGFSLCTVGVVLDGDTSAVSPQLMGITFLDLNSGTQFPHGGYNFNYVTPANASYVPRIFRSPDGTILIVASASTTGPSTLTAAVFDQENPGANPNTNCQSSSLSNAFSASITTGNQVSISLAGTGCFIPIH